ncbi:MAG: tetratricopeptide repeat protein [Alphaproteobacteria bacterium]|nr:tetratricopeptide repeat protein [Alphaproteobacteria bacterium]
MHDKRRIAAEIRDYLARERISREQFAFQTKLGKSTVDRLLTGLFSDRTVTIVETHTGLSLRGMLEQSTSADASPLQALDQPSIAVLPFANMSGGAEHDYIADGISDDLITELARLRWLLVIARNSSFAYRGKAADVRRIARELGVRYVLEGSVRVAAQRIRIVCQLIDAETRKHIWAERYDRELSDIFAVQDEITERTVAAVEPHLYAEEGFRAASKPPESIDAWGLTVRALALLTRITPAQNAEALALLHHATKIEPNYARAYALLGWGYWLSAQCQWFDDSAARHSQAATYASQALALDPSDPWGRMVSGMTLSSAAQHERALAELRKALDLNPSFALGHMAYGWALLRTGHFDEAIAETGRALRMSPTDSFAGFYTSTHALALLGAKRFAEALPFLRDAVAAFPEYPGHLNTLISVCGQLGLLDEARETLAVRNKVAAPLRVSVVRRSLGRYAHGATFVEGLVKAGVPE